MNDFMWYIPRALLNYSLRTVDKCWPVLGERQRYIKSLYISRMAWTEIVCKSRSNHVPRTEPGNAKARALTTYTPLHFRPDTGPDQQREGEGGHFQGYFIVIQISSNKYAKTLNIHEESEQYTHKYTPSNSK